MSVTYWSKSIDWAPLTDVEVVSRRFAAELNAMIAARRYDWRAK